MQIILRAIQAITLCSLFAVGTTSCTAQTIWSIFWESDLLPCGDRYWNMPMTATGTECPPSGKITVSICPQPKQHHPYPYDQGKPITIIGYQIIQSLTVPTAWGQMNVGSYHGGDGADIFAMTGGIGTNSASQSFPVGMGIPQGTYNQPDAHIDVYGSCQSGSQRAFVNLLYIERPKQTH